jgi:alpha-glucoside transport system permease protein
LPFSVFLVRNFFAGLPRELLEAARLEGASEWQVFRRVAMPLGLPALVSVAVLDVVFIWNDLIVGLVMTEHNQPLLPRLVAQLQEFGTNLDVIGPAAFVSAMVPVCVYLVFQRYFVSGLLAGAER